MTDERTKDDGATPRGDGLDARLLGDILVVECGHRIAAGACGSLLAQLGARVVVIEPPHPGTAGKWRSRASMMAGKQSIVLDARNEDDRATAARLTDACDVLILDSDVPGSAGDLWERPRRREQIVCDITAFGHDGPLAGQGGSEAIVQALGGVVDTTGRSDRPPSIVGAPVLEMSTAVFAASAIVAALRVRRLHGFGQRIDMALFDMAINELINFLTLHFAGQPTTRSGNRHPLYTPWGSYRAKDGFVLICAVTADQFGRICQAVGQPELTTDARFENADARRRNHRAVDAVIAAWSAGRTVAECVGTMLDLGVACGPIVAVDKLAAEPNLIRRRMVARLRDPATNRDVAVPSTPIRGAPTGGLPPRAIPLPDADRPAILAMLAQRRPATVATVTGDAPRRLGALAGLRVVEIGHYTVAPLTSRHMGALGADVIKIESPQGDAVRHGVPLRADGLAHIFALSNTDKRGLVLDLGDAAHRKRLDRLLAQSDVLVENLRQGSLAKFGFGTAALRARHPHLVYCSINGFGNDSAYPGRPALDTVIQAMSGLMSLTEDDGEPVKAGVSASDALGGQFGLLALLAGLEYRDRTGTAVHFDISMHDASVWMTQVEWPDNPPVVRPSLIAAADGYVVAEGEPRAIRTAVGAGAWPGERASLVSMLRAAGFGAAPVLSVGEAVEHPQTKARRLLVERPTADHDSWMVLNCPLRLCDTPPEVRTAMSRLGSEDAQVIAEFALDADEAIAIRVSS